MVTTLNSTPSVIDQYLRELRDVDIQQDKQRFERNLERLGMLLGYEISKHFEYIDRETTTPLGIARTRTIGDSLVLATILRAGLPVQHGLKSVFDMAELAFVAAGRKPETPAGVEIDLAYTASPELGGKTLILADTMLATGHSLIDAHRELTTRYGQPRKIFIAGVVGSQEGVDFIEKHIPDAEIFVCTIDSGLNDKFYIVPGLGDAGDLLYGTKVPKAS